MKYRRARNLKLTSFVATPVHVPLRAGFRHDGRRVVFDGDASHEESHRGAAPVETGAADADVKYILRAGTNKGLVGLGETRRGATVEQLRHHAAKLHEIDFDILQINRLPLPHDESHDAFELAVYDILGLELRVPVYQLLGDSCRERVWCASPGRVAVPSSDEAVVQHAGDVVIVSGRTPEQIVRGARAAEAQRGQGMKLWVAPAWHQTFDAAGERQLQELAKLLDGLPVLAVELYVEDQISTQGLSSLARLRSALPWPVCLDVALEKESLHPPCRWLIEAMALQATDGFSFRHTLAPFVRLADAAALGGLPCRGGGDAELGILEAGHAHAAAASHGCTWPSRIFGRQVRQHDLLVKPLEFSGHEVVVPQRPGLGVSLDIRVMERFRAGQDIVLDG